MGFYKPTEGQILVNGVDLADLNMEHYWEQVGFVSQNSFIYHDNVR